MVSEDPDGFEPPLTIELYSLTGKPSSPPPREEASTGQ